MWNDGVIPFSELWIKMGGDKGYASFKHNLQVVNVTHQGSRVQCQSTNTSTELKCRIVNPLDRLNAFNV